MESIKDNPDFCNTVLDKHIYTVSYHKNIKDIENFIFINYQDDDNILSEPHKKFNDSIQKKINKDLNNYKIELFKKYKDANIINDWLNIDDTIQTIINKIATYCIYDNDKNIYAWYLDKNDNPISLCFSYEFPIDNPFTDDIVDKRFTDKDNFINNIVNYKYNLLLEDIGEIKDNTIHVIQLEDYIKYKNLKNLEKTIQIDTINGIVRKYWPIINNNNDIFKSTLKSSLKNKLNILNIVKKQIKLVEDEYYQSTKSCDEFIFRYMKLDNSNVNLDNNDNVNIIKLFTDIQLSNKYPFSKLFLNSKEESYHKLHRDYLKIIDPNICSEWIMGSIFFMNNMLQYISQKNTFTIIIKINTNIYIRLLIDINGTISIIIDNRDNHDITIEILNDIIREANSFIDTYINKYLSYTTEKLKKIDFKWGKEINHDYIDFFNFTLKYDRTDIELNFRELKTLFKNLFVYTRVVEEDEKTNALTMRFKRISNYDTLDIREELVMKLKNPYLDLDDDEIVKILGNTFTITKEEIDKLLEDYESNNNQEMYFKKMIEPGTEIILTYNTQYILVNINNVKTTQEFNRVVYFIEFAIDFYKKYKSKKIKQFEHYFSKVENFANQYDKINKKDEEELEINNLDDIDLDDIDLDDIDLDELKDKHDLFSETYDSATDTSNQILSLDDLIDSSDLSSLEEGSSSQSGGGKNDKKGNNFNRYISKRLNERVGDLFHWPGKEKKQYSRICQTGMNNGARQPIVIDDKELNKINNGEEEGSGRSSYSNIITIDKYHYICPQYWDTSRDLSLDYKNPNWDRNDIILPKNLGDTNKNILQRVSTLWGNDNLNESGRHPELDTSVFEVRYLAADQHPKNIQLPCCFKSKIKGLVKETNVLSDPEVCYKNYCFIHPRLKIYFNQDVQKDKFFVRKGIENHTISDCIVQILTSELNIYNTIEYGDLFDSYYEKNKSSILQSDTDLNKKILENIRKNIIEEKKIREIQENIFFTILQNDIQKPLSDKLINIFRKNIWNIKNGIIESYQENYESKEILDYIHTIIEKSKSKTKTQQKINIGSNVQWYEKDKLLTGVVVSITTKSYRVCCKPNKKEKDKGSTYLVPQINKKHPERQIKLMVETDKDIIDKYLKNTTEKMIYMINPIISIINKYNYYYKSQNFLKDLIEFIRQNINKYTESGNGNIVNIFKIDKKDLTDDNAKDFIQEYPKYKKYDTVEKLYEYFQNNMEIYELFTSYISSKNFIKYLTDEKEFKDDLYTMPIICEFIKTKMKSKEIDIQYVVFELHNGDIRIKNSYTHMNNDCKTYSAKNSRYIYLYKIRENYEPLCFKNVDQYTYLLERDSKDYRKVIEKTIEDINSYNSNNNKLNILTYQEVINKSKFDKVYIHNNRMTHLITTDNCFVPIYPCFMKNCKLKFIYDIKDLELKNVEINIKNINKINGKEKIYNRYNIVVKDGKVYNIIFENKSYIPIKDNVGKIKLDVKGENELFKLDKDITLNIQSDDKGIIFTDHLEYELEIMNLFIQNMLVYFKTQYKRHEVQDIGNYKIGNKYDGGIITNILLLNNNTGTVYTSTDVIDNVQSILKDEIKLKIHKIEDLYQMIVPLTKNIIHKLSDKEYEKIYKLYMENSVCIDKPKDICNYPCFWNRDECKLYIKETSIIDGSNLIDRLIYRFIELLIIYGIDKENDNNIYNSIDSKVELHTLKNTVKRNEIFIPFLEDYKEYLEYLFVKNEYINIIDIDKTFH